MCGMEAMDIDEEAVVDLSVSGREPTGVTMPTTPYPRRTGIMWPRRRSLRPRNDRRRYMLSPEMPLVFDDEPRTNGLINGNCDSDDEEFDFPEILPVKEFSSEELLERKSKLKKLKDELRNEEMTLVLLKKLRQSHQLKENIAVVAPCQTPTTPQPQSHVKPVTPRSSSKASTPPQLGPMIRNSSAARTPLPPPAVNPLSISLSRSHHMLGSPGSVGGLNSNISKGSNNISRNMGMSFPVDSKETRNSPVPLAPQQAQHTGNMEKVGIPGLIPPDQIKTEDSSQNNPAARQQAAKAALRKQLEKTLLQIPPPKPPPPEMHFIPNPSNTEFIYLVGLEHVVDFITKDSRSPPPPDPFRCSQCSTNFTPVWKWEKSSSKGKEPKVICEQCVTHNVKKGLKAEHTNRLKTAFVKALQQEQELEQRLGPLSPKPEPPPPTPQPPPAAKPSTPKPPPSTPTSMPHSSNMTKTEIALARLSENVKLGPQYLAAQLQSHLFRGMPPPQHQPLPAHLLQFSPLLYPYQIAMASAANKNPVSMLGSATSIAELQRQAADIQRQYLLDMIPPPNTSRHSISNWKS